MSAPFAEATPAQLGYRMPAEWEPHRTTWLSWPHNLETWPENLEAAERNWTELIRLLATGEEVHVLASGDALASARQHVGDIPGVTLHNIPTNDAWMRDHGPIFLAGPADAPPALIDWQYNAWGGKYPPWENDNAVPGRLAEVTGRRAFQPGIVLEGGSIEVNGRGTLLTTEQCLLHPNRNPQLSREEIETCLRDYLGVRHILWLGEGIAGDDTDGHVDDLTRFVAPHVVVTVVENDRDDVNYQPLQDNLQRLRDMRDQDGNPLKVVTLPMPRPLEYRGERMPASYANFYIGNSHVVVPTFDDPADDEALETLARLFPTRQVVGIHAVDLIVGLGALHCITQQEPA